MTPCPDVVVPRAAMRRTRSHDVIIPIEDPDDPRFRQFRLNERGLASRTEKRDDAGAGLFFAEGDLVIERALAAGCVPVAALVDADHVPPLAAVAAAAPCTAAASRCAGS